jgi:hypothetical protein
MIHVAPSAENTACSACGEMQPRGCVAMTISEVTILLCQECGEHVANQIPDKLRLRGWICIGPDELTSEEVSRFGAYPFDSLLDEVTMCTVLWRLGPLDGDKRRIATALMGRLAALGIAHKRHRAGCEIWPKYRLCDCPWEIPS